MKLLCILVDVVLLALLENILCYTVFPSQCLTVNSSKLYTKKRLLSAKNCVFVLICNNVIFSSFDTVESNQRNKTVSSESGWWLKLAFYYDGFCHYFRTVEFNLWSTQWNRFFLFIRKTSACDHVFQREVIFKWRRL